MIVEKSGQELYDGHLATGEPLGKEEVEVIVRDGVATWDDFDDVGGGLWVHVSFDANNFDEDEG